MAGDVRSYSISELGAAFGLSRSTLLYYDRLGLLTPSGRTGAGYRRYGAAEYERLERICRYRELGLSLREIHQTLVSGKRPSVATVRRRLREVEGQIASLANHRRLLQGLLRQLSQPDAETTVDKSMWVEMLRVAGMDDEAMRRWHVEFERRAPGGHATFLTSLGIPAAEVDAIRQWSRRQDKG